MNRPGDSHQITINVEFGRKPNLTKVNELLKRGCVAVLDLTVESNAPTKLREQTCYHNLGWLDLTHPTVQQLEDAAAWIANHHQRGLVYIHCQLGLMRSASVAAVWLIEQDLVEVDDAICRIKKMEPLARFDEEMIGVLQAFTAKRKQK